MKNLFKILLVLWMVPFIGNAQEGDDAAAEATEKQEEKLERPAFESSYLIDNQTNVLLNKNALEVMFQHRFGLIDDWGDFYGIWGGANIRIAASYGIHERVTLGFGSTKGGKSGKLLQDLNWKVALLRQTRSNKMPVSLTYYGNFTYRADKQDIGFVGGREVSLNEPPINYKQDRYSYFHQLILARRFGQNLSLQFAPSLSHYNTVYEGMDNDVFAIAIGGRYKISPQTAILLDYSQPLSSYEINGQDLQPGFSLGFEFGTSGHAFQLFVTNNWGIVNQDNYMWNTHDFWNGDILLGFNITRVYNF